MKQAWCIEGHTDDDEEDNDVNNNSAGLKTSLGMSRTSKVWSGSKDAMNVGGKDTSLLNIPTRKRKDKWKRLAL